MGFKVESGVVGTPINSGCILGFRVLAWGAECRVWAKRLRVDLEFRIQGKSSPGYYSTHNPIISPSSPVMRF